MLTSLLDNLISAPVLFFALGAAACFVKSDLDIPQPIPKLLSLYLLIAIGLKGGVGLRMAEPSFEVIMGVGIGVGMSFLVPIWTFFLLKRKMGSVNAAGIAATYGSISAVTFIIAASFLDGKGYAYGGHMVATMALMESPAIIVGILLANKFQDREPDADGKLQPKKDIPWGKLFHESSFNSAVVLLLGSMVIGWLIGEKGFKDVKPFMSDPFKGILCLFLLDMGLVASRRLGDLTRAGVLPMFFAVAAAPVHAGLGISAAWLCNLSPGDALLIAVLTGSASYIAVPAALRLSLPKANPSIYVPMSLGLTFPFNVVVGIPLYWAVITWMWKIGS